MSEYKTHNDTDKLNFSIINELNSEANVKDSDNALAEEQSNFNFTEASELTVSKRKIAKKVNSENIKRELSEDETKLADKERDSIFQQLKAKTAATLVGSAVMLPILSVGTATYYFGSKAVNKQAILARRLDNIGLSEAELVQQQKLLAALLIGTGTTALLAGGVAAWGTKRLLDYIARKSEDEVTSKIDESFALSPSATQKEILQKIVREAHGYLQCDRVVVYSLDRDRSGEIVAESVIPAYTKALGQTIEDPCLEFQARDGSVMAINDIYEAGIDQYYIEQLEKLEVKASLVTSIVHHDKLWGLLVAHQCQSSRQWQQTEIDFLSQLSNKAGLALENARLLEDIVHLQTQAQTERKWTHEFTDVVQYLRQSIKQDDILDTSVKEVRKVLKCDRVVVYSLDRNQYGVVIAESVAPGYTKAFQKTIEDPCFETRYLEKYRDGRVRAINNIYEAGMSQCYIEQLENLEVKANLVTPILNEGKLFGLLVAHQCSDTRLWQDYEIRWMTQIATQVGFALDNAILLTKSRKSANATQLLKNFSLSIDQVDNRWQILKIAVEQIRKAMELDRVMVYQFDKDWNGTIVAESVIAGYPRAENSPVDIPYFARDYVQYTRNQADSPEVPSQRVVEAIADIHNANLNNYRFHQLESLGVKASLVVPILQEGQLFGLAIAHQCQQTRLWEQSSIDLFAQIALQLEITLDRVSLKEKLNLVRQFQNHENQQQQQISQLITKNKAALEKLRAKINYQSVATDDFLDRIETIEQKATITTPDYPQLQQQFNYAELTEAQKAIAQTSETERLHQSHQLYQMANLIDDIKAKIDTDPTKPGSAQLPATTETNEITIQPVNQETATNSILMNQFVGEIANLSHQMSQQSLAINHSFQKLAAFAKKLSQKDSNPN